MDNIRRLEDEISRLKDDGVAQGEEIHRLEDQVREQNLELASAHAKQESLTKNVNITSLIYVYLFESQVLVLPYVYIYIYTPG